MKRNLSNSDVLVKTHAEYFECRKKKKKVISHISRWLARLWNTVVVPRVEEAIIARVTTKCSVNTPASLSQRPSLSNCGLSAGQQAVVKAALSILVNKAVLLGCPLRRHGGWAPRGLVFQSLLKIAQLARLSVASLLQRWTNTCWSSAAGPFRCRASAPLKEAVVGGAGEGETAAS